MRLLGSTRAKRCAHLLVTTMALAVAGVAVSGGIASARYAEIVASASCADGGGWTVSYTATAWAGDGTDASRTNSGIAVDAATDGGATSQVGSGAFSPDNGFSFSGSFHVDEPASTVAVTTRIVGVWGTGQTSGHTRSTSVTLPTGCQPPPTTTTTTTTSTTTTTTMAPTTTTTPPVPGGGCTPGYWKNHPSAWRGYSPAQTVGSVFSGADAYGLDDDSLLTALRYGGGSGQTGAARNLLRAAAASVLNASNDGFEFGTSAESVISQVSAALATGNRATMLDVAASLDAANNAGCPL